MSLRFRLIGLVAMVLMVSLAVGGVIAGISASRSVRTEMRSALLVGRQAVENAVAGLPEAHDPQRDLDNLIASFGGNRHLRVSLTGVAGAPAIAPPSDKSPFGSVPAWFIGLIGVAPATDLVPVTVADRPLGTIVLETDPHNEILEVWNQFNDNLVVLALFCGLTIVFIHLVIGRALRPLERLNVALEQVGRGDYGRLIHDDLAPELRRLRDSFNRMTGKLAAMDVDNRRLNEQLLTLQEAERSELARDLHDEVSPFLFAVNVDVATISRLMRDGRAAEIPEHVQSIAEAVGHMQREVRGMLGRLRPIGLDEFGLVEAIGNMIEFWRRRHPDIDYRVTIAPGCDDLGELIAVTTYRIVQECLSNALRHGAPTVITVRVANEQDAIVVEVADDGHGLREPAGKGLGLRGMAERVKAVSGRLSLSDRPGGGCVVTAVLPKAAQLEAVA
jgi:two-component system sensor histidine kinase UhpB